MTVIHRIDPPSLPRIPGGAQVVVATRGSLVFVNGQVSRDAGGVLVAEGDLVGQVHQVFSNLRLALEHVGLTGRDVVQYRLSLVDYDESQLAAVVAQKELVFNDAPIDAAGAVIGVRNLAKPDFLAELEAIAIAGAVEVPDDAR